MSSKMLLVFLPKTSSDLCQNWIESLDYFKNFVLDLCCLSLASEMAVRYFFLTSTIFRKFAGDCRNLYLLTDSFIPFLAAIILLFHQPLPLLFDISVRPVKLVAEPSISSVNLLACWSITFSEISKGKFVETSSRDAWRNCFHFF